MLVVLCSQQTQHLPYVPLRVAHVHSTAIAHHDQPIYLSKLQDCRDRQPRNQQRTPSHSTQRRPHLPQYALLTSASDHEQRHSRARQSRQSQPDGGELLTSTAEQLVLSTASPSPFTRRTSAERTSAAPLDVSALLLPPDITDSQQSMATDDTIPPDILSPTFSSQSSLLPTILTPPRAASQQRRSSSLLSLSLSSSSSFSSSSTGPLAPPVSRSLSFQLPSSSSFVSALACTLSYFSPAPTFDAMTEDGLPPTTETNPPLLVTPPPLVSKKTAPHFRMANRTQQPQLICPTLTPSKEEQQLEPVDGSGKENATPASVTRKQHTPRSHKDLFAVKTPSARRQAVSLGGSARVHETRGIEWLNEERASAMRRLRSMR